LLPAEDVYGTRKCVAFASETVVAARAAALPARVLDAGCGTGEKLTAPLAHMHADVSFVGADVDGGTIAYARRACVAANLKFILHAEIGAAERFDVIIAAEVVEHVENPVAFLRELRERLAPGGRIVLTVPNGYGPSELASFLQSVLAVTGLLALLRRVKRVFAASRAAAARDTLAVSPHINFFSWHELHRVLHAAGLRVRRYRSRVFVCGFGFDAIVRGARAVAWNTIVAERLPPRLVSGWMFELEPVADWIAGDEHIRGALARLRRWLNEKRSGLR